MFGGFCNVDGLRFCGPAWLNRLNHISRNDRATRHGFGSLVGRVPRREAGGEGEGFEAGGGGVARVVTHAQPRAHAQRPEFVEAAVEDAEGGVVGAGDRHAQIFGNLNRWHPCKNPVFGNHRCNDKAFDRQKRFAQSRTGITVKPPVVPMKVPAYVQSRRFDVFLYIGKWRFKQGSVV